MDRLELLDRLKRLKKSQLEEIIFRLESFHEGISAYLNFDKSSPTEISINLIKLVEQYEGGLVQLQITIDELFPALIKCPPLYNKPREISKFIKFLVLCDKIYNNLYYFTLGVFILFTIIAVLISDKGREVSIYMIFFGFCFMLFIILTGRLFAFLLRKAYIEPKLKKIEHRKFMVMARRITGYSWSKLGTKLFMDNIYLYERQDKDTEPFFDE